MNEHRPNKIPGLYIHVPFCRSKCPYCAFYSTASPSLMDAWFEAVKKELLFYKDRFHAFDSLYIGGGTPTCLETPMLGSLMDHLFAHFDFSPDSEITIEANPSGLNLAIIKALKALGINRVSLGVQSFDDKVLSYLGRRHSGLDAERALEHLIAAGIRSFSLDLIYGLERQTLKDWVRTLRQALAFQPDHLSCYQLTIEKGTPFWVRQQKGKIGKPDEESETRFFLATSRFLEDQGYIHYEISSFARTRESRSRHNRKYWNHTPYLGLGPSAHSFGDRTRWWNVRSIRQYAALVTEGRRPIEGEEALDREALRTEAVALGLRTRKGVFQKEIQDVIHSKERLETLEEQGFLRIRGGRILPTRKGFLVADQLPVYLLSD